MTNWQSYSGSSTTPTVSGNTVLYNGNTYQVLPRNGVPISPTNMGGAGGPVSDGLPGGSAPIPDGWGIAPDNADSIKVIVSQGWGTGALTVGVASSPSYFTKGAFDDNSRGTPGGTWYTGVGPTTNVEATEVSFEQSSEQNVLLIKTSPGGPSSDSGASSNGWSKMVSPGGTVAYNIGKPSCDSGEFWNVPQGDCAYAACPQGTKAQWIDDAADNPSIQSPSNIPSCMCKSASAPPSSTNISAPQPNTACDSDQVVTKGEPDSDGTGNITTYLNPEGMKIYSTDISNIFSTDFYDGRIYFYAEQPTGQNLTADPINKRGTDSNGTLYLYTNLNPQGLRIRASAASCFSAATSVYLGGPPRSPPTKTKAPAGPQTLHCPSSYPNLLPNPDGTISNYFCYKSINGNSGEGGGLCNCNCANCGYNPAYANCSDLGSQCAASVPGNPNNIGGLLTGNELVDTCSESQSATLPIQPPLTSEFTSLRQTYLGPAPQNVLTDSANTISQRLADISTSRTGLYDRRRGKRKTFDQYLPIYKKEYEKLQAQDTKTTTLWAMEEETKLYNASERIRYITWATAAITLSAVFLHGLAK